MSETALTVVVPVVESDAVLDVEGLDVNVSKGWVTLGVDLAKKEDFTVIKGVNSDTASRALYAYRRSMGLVGGLVGQQPFLASVH